MTESELAAIAQICPVLVVKPVRIHGGSYVIAEVRGPTSENWQGYFATAAMAVAAAVAEVPGVLVPGHLVPRPRPKE